MQRAAAAFRVAPIKSTYEQRFDAIFDSFTHYFEFVKDIALCAFLTRQMLHTLPMRANRKKHKSKVQTRKIEKKTSTIRP